MQKRYHCSGYLITSAALNHAVGISNNQKHGILSISRDDRWLCFKQSVTESEIGKTRTR